MFRYAKKKIHKFTIFSISVIVNFIFRQNTKLHKPIYWVRWNVDNLPWNGEKSERIWVYYKNIFKNGGFMHRNHVNEVYCKELENSYMCKKRTVCRELKQNAYAFLKSILQFSRYLSTRALCTSLTSEMSIILR